MTLVHPAHPASTILRRGVGDADRASRVGSGLVAAVAFLIAVLFADAALIALAGPDDGDLASISTVTD